MCKLRMPPDVRIEFELLHHCVISCIFHNLANRGQKQVPEEEQKGWGYILRMLQRTNWISRMRRMITIHRGWRCGCSCSTSDNQAYYSREQYPNYCQEFHYIVVNYMDILCILGIKKVTTPHFLENQKSR